MLNDKNSCLQNLIKQRAVGTARPTISKQVFLSIKIPLPPIEEQQKIVDELDRYQKIIDGAKQVMENWKPYLEIDENWAYLKIKDICLKILGGGTPSTNINSYWNGNIPWITSANINAEYQIKLDRCISYEGLKNSSSNLIPKNTLLVVTRVGVGKLAITKNELAINQDIQALFIDENKVIQHYLMYALSYFIKRLEDKQRGTTIKGITKDALRNTLIPLPPLPIQKEIVNQLETERKMIESQKDIVKTFEEKIKNRLNTLWRSEKESEPPV